jgi:hypothetical protein
VDRTPSSLGTLELSHRKIMLPKGELTDGNVVPIHLLPI